jgi:Rrf2 family nitric oxide-sensitive transcriptional repressor
MQLNLKTDYSLRLLLFLALYPEELVPVSRVAHAFQISVHHLSKVAQGLSEAGFVELVRGRGGGMRLAVDPARVAVSEVIRAVEGSFALVECFQVKGNTCAISPVCALKGILAEAQSAFFGVLERYTLADVVRNPRALRGILAKTGGEEAAR